VKKSGIGQSGLAVMILLAGGFLMMAGVAGCSDNGTTVKVETTPSAAKVFIDGKFVGLSPCECFIRDSQPDDLWEQHTVEVKAKGFESQSRRLRYRTGAAWLPDKIEFVMSKSLLIDEPENASRDSKASAEPSPTDTRVSRQNITNKKSAVVETPKEVTYRPAEAERIKKFKAAAPWTKAAPINDDNLQASQLSKKSDEKIQTTLAARHAEMEKTVVAAKGSSLITAPTLPELEPTNSNTATKESSLAVTHSKTDEPQAAASVVPLTRPRLAPLPKQVTITKKPSSPQFIGSVPWRNISSTNRQHEIELISAPVDRHVIPAQPTENSKTGEKTSCQQAAPWLQAGGLGIEKSQPENAHPITQPQDTRMLSCDIRIARVSDGVVLHQASGVDTYANMADLAHDLVVELAAYVPDDSSVAIFCFHNRRNTNSGRLVADKMLEAVVDEVLKSPSLKFIKTVNIRDALGSETSLEQSKQLTKPRFYPLLKNAEYVIIGGVSLFDTFADLSTKPTRETGKED